MNTHADKTQENKSQSVSHGVSQMQSGGESTFQFVDNRPEAVTQRKLQEMADNSPQVQQLRAFQEMANNSPQVSQLKVLQREVDTSSSPSLPDYDEVPAWKDEGGVPEWAKREFLETGGWRTIMASMTPDGMIGSLYYSNSGRMRTVHSSGPEKETDPGGQVRLRYNIRDGESMIAYLEQEKGYKAANKRSAEDYIGRNDLWEECDWWIADKLKDPTNLPDWAQLLDDANSAIDLGEQRPEQVDDKLLFELTKDAVTDQLKSKHPSRGFAVKYGLSQAALTELDAIYDELGGLGTAEERNQYFYDQLKARLPGLQYQIRKP